MTRNFAGWTVLVAALGMMMGLMAIEISQIEEWQRVTTPQFVGKSLAHFATVIGAFIGGKLLPTVKDVKDE